MKKLCLFLVICLMTSMLFSVPAFAETEEEEDNSGTITIVEDDGAEIPELTQIEESEPFVPEGVEKAVFGHDDRYEMNPTKHPYVAIGMLVAKGTCGCSWMGSGFMVSKNFMLTAAHCLVCTKHSAWAQSLDIYFGYRNSRNYYYKYSDKWDAWAGNLFKNKKYTIEGDWAVIKFKKNVGNKTGWFGWRFGMSQSDFDGDDLYYVAGYRDEKVRMAAGYDIRKDKDGFLNFTMDTVPGNSGGPIFTQDNIAVGIIIAENSLYNTGYPLNAAIKNKWDEMK